VPVIPALRRLKQEDCKGQPRLHKKRKKKFEKHRKSKKNEKHPSQDNHCYHFGVYLFDTFVIYMYLYTCSIYNWDLIYIITGFHYVVQAGLELSILLPDPPKC
jgi:hypothetical protein